MRSAHTRLIDSVLNNDLRIVTGCLRPTPTDHLPILLGIQPAELRRMGVTLSLAHRGSLDPNHILHGLLSRSFGQIVGAFSYRSQRYLPHPTKVRYAISKNLVMQRMTCMP